jgi:hypothetical protein
MFFKRQIISALDMEISNLGYAKYIYFRYKTTQWLKERTKEQTKIYKTKLMFSEN